MRRARTLSLLFLIALAPLLGGCRTLGRGGATETVMLDVANNLPIPTGFTVYAADDAGARRLLGSLRPGGSSSLTMRAREIAGRYRFIAVPQLDATITSPYINLQGGETVLWDLRANTVTIAR